MRVAIYHNLPPGGALRVLEEFVRRTGDDHEYHLYTPDLGVLDGFAYAGGRTEQRDLTGHVAAAFRYPVVPRWAGRIMESGAWTLSAPGWMDRMQRRVAADIDARRYDVALVHPCRITHTPGLLRHLRTPSLHYMHEHRRRSFEAGYQEIDCDRSFVRRAAAGGVEQVLRHQDRAAALAAGRIVCNSWYTAECAQRSYGRDAVVCRPGVDTDVFDLAPEGSRSRSAGVSVLAVGALDPSKGHDLLVRALALLPVAGRPALDLVYERCDAAYRTDVEALAASAGVELRLHFGIADAHLAGLYRAASATVVAARLEPLGLVPLESLACGTPVVAVREAGYRETVDDGRNGFLVERSPAGLAHGVSRILAGALAAGPSELRAGVVRRWGWDAAAKRLVEQLAITAEPRVA